MERTKPAPLTVEETQQVLQRASELGRQSSSAHPLIDANEPSLDLAELEKIGLESGMTREQIQRAYLELRTGKLVPPPDETFADRTLGPASIFAERPLAMLPEETARALESELKKELLHAAEQDGEKIIWAQAPGVWAALQRGFKGHQVWKHATLISDVKMAPPGLAGLPDELSGGAKSLLKLEASVQGRLAPVIAALGFSTLPAFVSVACAVDTPHQPGLALFFAAVTAGVGALSFSGFKQRYLRRVRSVRLGVTRVLDRVSGRL
jgi:hypothetical protein